MNSKITSLIVNIGVFIIAVIGIFLISRAMGSDAVVDPLTGQTTTEAADVSAATNFSMLMVYLCLGAIALFTVIAIISNPKRFIPVVIGLAVFGLLILIARSLVTIETTGDIMKLEGTTDGTLFWGGLGIKTTFVLVIVAIGLIVAQMVRGLLGYFSK
jgi:hypothetical protein